mgnify:CR=1 FL=1
MFNRSYGRTEKLMNEHGNEGEFFPAKTLEEFVDSLVKPRTAIIMVKAGEPTDAMINALADLMDRATSSSTQQRLLPGHHSPREGNQRSRLHSSDAVCPAVRKALCLDLP